MGMSDPRLLFGIHSFTGYDRATGLFKGTAKVVKGSTFSTTGELIELTGGSSKIPWGAEDGAMSSEISLKTSEYANWMLELFVGAAVTANAAEATGNVSAVANKKGASVVAATGLASVSAKAGSEGDMKFGRYVIKATDATHVDVYVSSDADLSRGTDGAIQDDLMKITAAPLVIAQGADADVPNFGIKLTGGAGVIALVAGDTATFEVRPKNSKSTVAKIGKSSSAGFPEFGAILMGQKRGNDELIEIDVFRCKAAGMPFGFEANAWAEAEIKIKALYDSARDGVAEIRHVTAA